MKTKYMMLLIGSGEGCDHTIECNRKWVNLEGCTSIEEAVDMAKLMLVPTGDPDHETSENIDIIASGRVLELSDARVLEIDDWRDKKHDNDREREKEAVKEKDMQLLATMREKYPEEFPKDAPLDQQ